MTASRVPNALVPIARRVWLDSPRGPRSDSSAQKQWQPSGGLSPEDVTLSSMPLAVSVTGYSCAFFGRPAPASPRCSRCAQSTCSVRSTRNLPLAHRLAGWSRLQMAYLTVGDDEGRQLMQQVPE